ncbi:MAG: phosphoribosylglycinamide formyltransferase [Xanthomonadales bacterium]|nr:phosphoribosylglycinamide formyltransferase [Xanthomonadales bacterium]
MSEIDVLKLNLKGSASSKRKQPLSAVVLISGGGSNLQALIDQTQQGLLNLKIRAVISNRPDVQGLKRARRAGIAALTIDHRGFFSRAEFEAALAQAIDDCDAQLIILAGFMRVLGTDFVNRYPGRMINLHPSLLPKYPGLHTYRRALEAGDSEHGASIHFVTAELDGGPVIAQARIPIHATDDEHSLQQRLSPVEHRLLVAVVGYLATGRLSCHNGRVCLDSNALSQPLELVNEQDLALSTSHAATEQRQP